MSAPPGSLEGDLEKFRTAARDWLAAQPVPVLPSDLDGRFDALRAWQSRLHDAGWTGLAWPCAYGGRGLTPAHQIVFNQELARRGAPPPANLVGLEVVGPSVVAFGSEEQKRRLLPGILSGAEIWCQGFSEPEAGSDLASLTTRAEPAEAGDGWVLSGHKVWTTWAHKAQWCGLLARTGPPGSRHRGISYFLLDMATPGVEARPLMAMTGDAEFGEVLLERASVPASALLGEVDQGWQYAMHTLSCERGSFALTRAVEVEVAFGELVAGLRGSAEPDCAEIGRLRVAIDVLAAQGERTMARLIERPGQPAPEDSADKLLLSQVEQAVFGAAEDLLGPWRTVPSGRPRGLDAGTWTHAYLYGRAASIYGGTAQIQRNIIGERLLGLPKT